MYLDTKAKLRKSYDAVRISHFHALLYAPG